MKSLKIYEIISIDNYFCLKIYNKNNFNSMPN